VETFSTTAVCISLLLLTDDVDVNAPVAAAAALSLLSDGDGGDDDCVSLCPVESSDDGVITTWLV